VLGTYRFSAEIHTFSLSCLYHPSHARLIGFACSVIATDDAGALDVAAILWIEGWPQRPLFLLRLLIDRRCELTKYFGASLILLLFVYSIAGKDVWELGLYLLIRLPPRRIRVPDGQNVWSRTALYCR